MMRENAVKTFEFSPIGIIRNAQYYRYEAPRQAVFATEPAFLEWLPGFSCAEAAEDLKGFDRIWIIFVFHLNSDRCWKPKVTPPVSPDGGRYSVFSTRSPHRPNPIGISCVELLSVEPEGLRLKATDILDRTPVLDVKPYIPGADSFPGSAAGWHDRIEPPWQVDLTPRFLADAARLHGCGGPDLVNFARIQLSYAPLDERRKRLSQGENGTRLIAFRTWRVAFRVQEEQRRVRVEGIVSGYAPEELLPDAPDRYGDKDVHRVYLSL